MDLRHGQVRVRPLRVGDAPAWSQIRNRAADWLAPWEATLPPGAEPSATTYAGLIRKMRQQADQGRIVPTAIEVDGRFVGQVTIGNLVRGSAQFGQAGYWIDDRYAGRGITPIACALVIDHCFARLGLHRIEVAIRPENTASLRVVEKLGLREYGFSRRYLHIDDAWRDHRLFEITAEECPEGLLARVTR